MKMNVGGRHSGRLGLMRTLLLTGSGEILANLHFHPIVVVAGAGAGVTRVVKAAGLGTRAVAYGSVDACGGALIHGGFGELGSPKSAART